MFHLLSWPDYGVPKSPDYILDLIGLIHDCQPNRLLVHCYNGFSQCGTFVALLHLFDEIQNGADTLNILEVVLQLRKDRKFIVSDSENFNFLYQCVAALIDIMK